ncbi:hypothetical conserved protein (plasmid) [Rhizobium etli CFN 42]|uniref:Hypothetical conserved protein n=1 Tax=Rhizobium etli (strain ATCC 51251 / DSM 11541 / JCM 21823 / NBRC 15573 / CFN 42) TaxID=347834 RepID=Q2K007_RHIEC|nr:hypothetical conserved protein [Rhizobium etli CFN 42]
MLAIAAVSLFAYTKVMARIGSGSPPPAAPMEQRADLIRVYKSERRMVFLKGDAPIAAYEISLGSAADAGPKQREGDEKTPEGPYEIDWRNPKSTAHLSLHISYPKPEEQRAAEVNGFPPGGNINDPRAAQWLGPARASPSPVGLDGWLYCRHQCGNGRDLGARPRPYADRHHALTSQSALGLADEDRLAAIVGGKQ